MRAREWPLPLAALLIAAMAVVWPLCQITTLWGPASIEAATTGSSLPVLIRTMVWAAGVAVLATMLGWPLGRRLVRLSPSRRRGILALLVATLVLPAYAIFHAWWQAWPADSALHGWLVDRDMLAVGRQATLAAALVGWSWPIAAMWACAWQRRSDLDTLRALDGVRGWRSAQLAFASDWRGMVGAVALIAAVTAANTTCFDLAQVYSMGNELRALAASGGSATPIVLAAAAVPALLAAWALWTLPRWNSATGRHGAGTTAWPVLAAWLVFCGGPILLAAAASAIDLAELMRLYGRDLASSLAVAAATGASAVVVLVGGAAMHASGQSPLRRAACVCEVGWILMALLPATLVAGLLEGAWNRPLLDAVYLSPAVLVLAHLGRVGIVAALAARWVAGGSELAALDGPRGPGATILALWPRLSIGIVVVMGTAAAISMGEVALTAQVAPPSRSQPIAVALLNAMHYQRPQIVMGILTVVLALAAAAGIAVALAGRRGVVSLILLCLVVGCGAGQDTPPLDHEWVVGGRGRSDGRFLLPRAIDARHGLFVVVDRSGRVQQFDASGAFLATWTLPGQSNGFPTGLTIDEEGLTWIADTHEHRVLVVDGSGMVVRSIGEHGEGDGQFLYPTDVAFLGGEVFVSEYGGNDRISVFTRDGRFLRSFGTHGRGDGEWRRPQSIAVDAARGHLLVVDSGNNRVIRCDLEGTILDIIGSAGRDRGQLLYPYGICMLEDGSFIVCEYGNNRLQRFSPDGRSLGVVGGPGDAPGRFHTPWAIAVDGDRLFVADAGNDRVQVSRSLPPIMATEW